MSHRPLIVPAFAPSRSVLLAGSFGACGVLLLVLFAVLMGCAPFETSLPDPEPQNRPNSVLCECECENPIDPLAVPQRNSIAVGSDDATQATIPGTAALTGSVLELGQGGLMGLRFQKIGVPPFATIIEARIQFTAATDSAADNPADLDVRVVNLGHVTGFTSPTNPPQPIDLSTLPLLNGSVDWKPGPWKLDEAGAEQITPDLKALLQAIVNRNDYSPDSAVAFVIEGSGRRTARSREGATSKPAPPYLTIKYQPVKSMTEFLACRGPDEDPAAVCGGRVDNNVSKMAIQCKVANACTCKVKPVADTSNFAHACNDSCGEKPLPADCNPTGFAQATQAKLGDAPVCIAHSPLGSALFGQRSACDLDPSLSRVDVTVLDDDGDEDGSASNQARGRVEFVGTTCVGGPCNVGVAHRLHIGDMKFDAGPFASDPVITDLTGVGKSSENISITGGVGAIPKEKLEHSGRGRQKDGPTRAYFLDKLNPLPMNVAVHSDDEGWVPGGVCSLHGDLVHTDRIIMSANLQGKLVNQPPIADAGPAEQQFECKELGQARFGLDGSESFDPDNNVAFFGWFRGSRTGDLVGNLPRVELTQAVRTTVPYVFKVIDTFGQYDEAWTSVSVVDTTAPVVTAPPKVTAECAGPTGTPVNLDPDKKAAATDVCDGALVPTDDAAQRFPLGFPLGTRTVNWSATDGSGNTGTATQTVLIQDTLPPTLRVTLSPEVLWPPDHKLVAITATITVTDICDPDPKVELVSIGSSEPDNGLGDGDKPEDIQEWKKGADDRTFLLRAERSGTGHGRVYTVKYKATDATGNSSFKEAFVRVPKSQ